MSSSPGRERVFCHACSEEWYRDEHGLVCPRPTCGSDVVEIIEGSNHPREDRIRFLRRVSSTGGEDDEGFVQVVGPRFTFTATQRPIGGPDHRLPGHDPANADQPLPVGAEEMVNTLATIVRTLFGDPPAGQPPHPASGEPPRQPGADSGDHDHPHHGPGQPNFGPLRPGGFAGSERFFYDSSARLNPRDADSPQPPGEPRVVDLTTILGLFATAPSSPFAQEANGQSPGGLFARLMGLAPGSEGDFVYSQAQLDRVITQLMEQHQGNAPPPASREAIDALPRIKVTNQMVLNGDDCAVCKEDLIVEEEVTKLPCSHCYHFDCVSKWLEAHNTCPICRHPLASDQRQQQPQSPNQQQRSTLWPFNTVPPSPSPHHSSASPPGDRGGGGGSSDSGSSNGRSGFANLFRRHNHDRST